MLVWPQFFRAFPESSCYQQSVIMTMVHTVLRSPLRWNYKWKGTQYVWAFNCTLQRVMQSSSQQFSYSFTCTKGNATCSIVIRGAETSLVWIALWQLAWALFSSLHWLEKVWWVFQIHFQRCVREKKERFHNLKTALVYFTLIHHLLQLPCCQYLQKKKTAFPSLSDCPMFFFHTQEDLGGQRVFFCLSQKGSLVSSQRKCASYSHVKPILRSNP